MNIEKFKSAYNESRNGTEQLHYGFLKFFTYSDGVKECADAGCHWLIDILATEGAQKIRKSGQTLVTVNVEVKKDKAMIRLLGSGDVQFWKRSIEYTDLPEGTWSFLIADEGNRMVMILLSEY